MSSAHSTTDKIEPVGIDLSDPFVTLIRGAPSDAARRVFGPVPG